MDAEVKQALEMQDLKNENALLEAKGLLKESSQCVKNVELKFDLVQASYEELKKAFQVFRRWLLGTNGNSINEDDIHESFISRFTIMEHDMKEIKKLLLKTPWYIKLWTWIKANPKKGYSLLLVLAGSGGFSAFEVAKVLKKVLILLAEVAP